MKATSTKKQTNRSNHTFELVLSDMLRLNYNTIANVIANLGDYFAKYANHTLSNWAGSCEYFYWKFWFSDTGTRSDAWPTEPIRFSSVTNLVMYLVEHVPNNGTSFQMDCGLWFEVYEKVDNTIEFPANIVHRNSLVASARGLRNWNRCMLNGFHEQQGIHANFSIYYGAYEAGRRFVEKYTGADPGVNNDEVVWWTRNMSTTWRPGSSPSLRITIPDPNNSRSICWDTVTNSFVVPLANDIFVAQTPFMWCESKKLGVLSIEDVDSSVAQIDSNIFGVSALVFPMLDSTLGRYVAFVVKPISFDTFYIPKYDTANYELLVQTINKSSTLPTRMSLTPTRELRDMAEFHTIPTPGQNNILASRAIVERATNNAKFPVRGEICLRNKKTGIRTAWKPFAKVVSRQKYARISILPWYNKQRG